MSKTHARFGSICLSATLLALLMWLRRSRVKVNLPIAIATKLEIIMTNAVLNPQGSVWGIAAMIKLFNKDLQLLD